LYLSRLENFKTDELLYLGFNQDHSCLAVGTTNGFRIFNCVPYKETFKRQFNGGIGIVEMLFRCNILALVGGGEEPAYTKNKVILWDDNQSTPIGELTFKTDVKAVKLRREKIVVVLENNVYVYNFEKLERSNKFDTSQNLKGLVAMSSSQDLILVFPHTTKGEVNIQLLTQNKNHIVKAHDGDIAALALNLDGTLLATASDKGTLIRIWDTATGNKIQEVRRGGDKATIYSIAFSHDNQFICTSSDKGTIHIFCLDENIEKKEEKKEEEKKEEKPTNRTSKLGGLFGGYFSSQWSFAYYTGPDCPSIVSFSPDSQSVAIVSSNGSFTRIGFDRVKGGECDNRSENKFF